MNEKQENIVCNSFTQERLELRDFTTNAVLRRLLAYIKFLPGHMFSMALQFFMAHGLVSRVVPFPLYSDVSLLPKLQA